MLSDCTASNRKPNPSGCSTIPTFLPFLISACLRVRPTLLRSCSRGNPCATSCGVVMGTPGYMSPEQIRGKSAEPSSDIFAFGTILYEMLCGNRAFSGETITDINAAILRDDPPEISQTDPTIPPGLEQIVRHCLEKSPDERFHSAHDL